MNEARLQLSPEGVIDPAEMAQLLFDFGQMKEQAHRLSLINDLHARLACAVDLAGMVDAFSVWLAPLVPHELLGLDAPNCHKRHYTCSNHGPDRRRVIGLAERLFANAARITVLKSWKEEGYYVHNWRINFSQESGLLLILRPDSRLAQSDEALMDDALTVLAGALHRALVYEDIFEESRRDSLTGLANRRVFEERLPGLMESARRHRHDLSLISMDLDCFKQINDNLGHGEGDRVLKLVADTFAGMIRASDILVRLGGDEFALILPDTDRVSARILAERLCRAIDKLDIYATPQTKLGVSIGLCQWHADLSQEQWLQKADELLYQAKGRGRNCVCTA